MHIDTYSVCLIYVQTLRRLLKKQYFFTIRFILPLRCSNLQFFRPILSHQFVFACLFIFGGFSSHSRIFHSDGNVTITRQGQQMLTLASHSWTLWSEGSLACYTYCGKVQSPRTRDILTPIAVRLAVELPLPVFWNRSVAVWIRTPNFPLPGRTLLPTAPPLRLYRHKKITKCVLWNA